MSSRSLMLTAAAITHHGCVRDHNEDCIGVGGWVNGLSMAAPAIFSMSTDTPTLCVVADGLGGHAGGEMASALAVQEVMRSVATATGLPEMSGILRDANAAIFGVAARSPHLSGMGATIVGVVLAGRAACVFNVGDCRAYFGRGADLTLVSVDDTWAFGVTRPSDRTGTHGHAVSQCLGGAPTRTILPHIVVMDVAAPARIILCSDGLTDMLDQAGIEACLAGDPAATVTSLLDAAIREGGTDNISVVCLDLRSK